MQFLTTFLICLMFLVNPAKAETYAEFLTELRAELKQKEIPVKFLNEALGEKPELDPNVLKRLKKQPESTYTFPDYYNRLVSKFRVKNGREKLNLHQDTLHEMAKKYDVPKEIMLALWGVETAYGKLTGDFNIINSLSTLAYKSHRKKFFRNELIDAIRILDEGHIESGNLTGSWAGAMGQCQFMPSSFFRFAADGNGDGRKDIWQTVDDVFASTGNYISKSGWRSDVNWMDKVTLTKILPKLKISERGLSEPLSMSRWQEMGVQLKRSRQIDLTRKARLFIPEGPSQRAYLVYENFDVILKWNRSSYFAFAVLSLADKIAGRAGVNYDA